MSEKFEPCTLEEATHVEVGNKMYKFGDSIVEKFKNGEYPTLKFRNEIGFYELINESSFTTFNIKPMREIKREPIEFEAIVKQDMPFAYLSNVPDGIPLGTKFKCVEILEEKKK